MFHLTRDPRVQYLYYGIAPQRKRKTHLQEAAESASLMLMSLRRQLTLWIGLLSLGILGLVSLTMAFELRDGGLVERQEELRTASRLYGVGLNARLGAVSTLVMGLAAGGGQPGPDTPSVLARLFESRPALQQVTVQSPRGWWQATRTNEGLDQQRGEGVLPAPSGGWTLGRAPLTATFCVAGEISVWARLDLARVVVEEQPGIGTPILLDDRSHEVLIGPPEIGDHLKVAGISREGDFWLSLAPMGPGQLRVGLAWPETEMLSSTDLLLEKTLTIGFVGNLLLLLLVWVVSGTITRPLDVLTAETVAIARGELNRDLPEVQGDNEVARLTRSFKEMQHDLQEYLSNLSLVIRDNERLQQELEIGARIQRSFLPDLEEGCQVEVVPGQLVLAPVFRAARELSGDFYDFFPVDPDRLGIIIGDVAGKGLSAGLMMARIQVLVRALGPVCSTPGECLAIVNRILCEDNRESIFATAIYLVYDRRHRRLTYASAGHLPPILVGSEVRMLPQAQGIILGVLDDPEFADLECKLGAGEVLVLYTDGATEAMDAEGELFGEARLLDAVRGLTAARACVGAIQEALLAFTGGQPLGDDLTLVALESL